jgi:hypothetical protein
MGLFGGNSLCSRALFLHRLAAGLNGRSFAFFLLCLVAACGQHDDPEATVKASSQALCLNPTLAVNPSTSAALGAQVTLTTTATCAGSNPEYQFIVYPTSDQSQYTVIRTWSTSSTATWDTSGLASGAYAIQGYVR